MHILTKPILTITHLNPSKLLLQFMEVNKKNIQFISSHYIFLQKTKAP